jgi:hypothetical protein
MAVRERCFEEGRWMELVQEPCPMEYFGFYDVELLDSVTSVIRLYVGY